MVVDTTTVRIENILDIINMRTALDIYDSMPKYMRKYLQNYGWHFNKALCKYAVSLLKKNGKDLQALTKEQVDKILEVHKITLTNSMGSDYIFVANLGKAKYYESSISDEKHFALYIKDTIDNENIADGTIMREWYTSMVAKGIMIDWEEFI